MDLDNCSVLLNEELDLLVFMHPIGTSIKERMGDHYFNNLIAHPLESALAVGHLIFDGYLEKYPGLKNSLGLKGGMGEGGIPSPHPFLTRAIFSPGRFFLGFF